MPRKPQSRFDQILGTTILVVFALCVTAIMVAGTVWLIGRMFS